ncbi:unnamed protein product [Vitrella brassicaformis CCMP3155]|uniref:Uncharacterized protein n=1 Tax=Vitrella brassicaformis (strain CCMP3155) TaxID=1169540 RepID=A0A0G4F0G9_VITBC|nr:unnamed protein product [Vitrella brassicaformis CCMP3155]|mmetsp:Transcript_41377/g.103273  ORF Transcript_41377/g.103273 Transcript_41377/m.103273 type:complete len:461 (+) Transcript_41377:172-1554(+)|eukprot:CEM04549.1 unnamed protein product [Vitrella brassicaformis CCMP3155]
MPPDQSHDDAIVSPRRPRRKVDVFSRLTGDTDEDTHRDVVTVYSKDWHREMSRHEASTTRSSRKTASPAASPRSAASGMPHTATASPTHRDEVHEVPQHQPDQTPFSARPPSQGTGVSRESRDAAHKLRKMETLRKIEELRETDHQKILSDIDRRKQREARAFEESMKALSRRTPATVEVGRLLRLHREHIHKKRVSLTEDWNRSVLNPLQEYIQQTLTEPPPLPAVMQAGPATERSLEWRRRQRASSPASARELAASSDEELFRRTYDSFFSPRQREMAYRSQFARRLPARESQAWKATPSGRECRPTMPPESWGELILLASPFNHTRDGGPPLVGRGRNIGEPSDHDLLVEGMTPREPAGLRKGGDRGILKQGGKLALQGEARMHLTEYGGSSAAPLQDHYHYSIGRDVTDREFSKGKRILPPPCIRVLNRKKAREMPKTFAAGEERTGGEEKGNGIE